MQQRTFFSLPTPFSFRSVRVVKYLFKGIPKQVIIYNKWFALMKQVHLGRNSNLGYNTRCDMTSKDRRRYRHSIEPTHICGRNTYYMQWREAGWHLTSNAMITTHNTYSNSDCAKARPYGLTVAAWQGALYMHYRCFFSLPTTFTFRPEPIVDNLIKRILKQVILHNKWFASTKQLHLRWGSKIGHNAGCCEMISKDRRRYHHTI